MIEIRTSHVLLTLYEVKAPHKRIILANDLQYVRYKSSTVYKMHGCLERKNVLLRAKYITSCACLPDLNVVPLIKSFNRQNKPQLLGTKYGIRGTLSRCKSEMDATVVRGYWAHDRHVATRHLHSIIHVVRTSLQAKGDPREDMYK